MLGESVREGLYILIKSCQIIECYALHDTVSEKTPSTSLNYFNLTSIITNVMFCIKTLTGVLVIQLNEWSPRISYLYLSNLITCNN